MLTRTTPCDEDRLRQLLDGTLSARSEAEVELHLESCEGCRRQLESLAARADWWQETRELLVGAVTSPSLAAISHDKSDVASLSLSSPEPADPPSLAFLSPSDNPAMLGRLGEFEVLEFIGRGGMGIVLKGYDHELNRFVAIKVLGPHYAENGAARKRFAREAQAAAAVVHQHVVAIHAVDANHRPPYFVMPFIPGESLQQRLDRDGPLEIQDVLRIGQQVAEGLAAAHAQGLVHRDIKPANILLERNVGRVLLTDFGLARAVDDASLTQSGIIAGTPQYMSPEQARGEAIDHRADLFSLGSVLYALLAGHPPFRADSPYGVLRRVTDDTPRSLREINPAVPDWLEMLIGRLLAKQPDQRWQSAQQVAGLLTRCLAHVSQPTAIPLPDEVAALVRRSSNRRTRSLAVVVSLVACVGLMSLARQLWPTIRNQTQLRPTGEQVSKTVSPPNRPSDAPSQQASTVSGKEASSWDDDQFNNVRNIDQRLRHLESNEEF